MVSPTFSDLELASHITIGVSNHHGIFIRIKMLKLMDELRLWVEKTVLPKQR